MGICCAPPLKLWEWEAFAREGGWVDLDKCLSKTKSSEFGFDGHFMWVWYANVSVNTFKKIDWISLIIFLLQKKCKNNIIHDSSKYLHLYSSKYEALVWIS